MLEKYLNEMKSRLLELLEVFAVAAYDLFQPISAKFPRHAHAQLSFHSCSATWVLFPHSGAPLSTVSRLKM